MDVMGGRSVVFVWCIARVVVVTSMVSINGIASRNSSSVGKTVSFFSLRNNCGRGLSDRSSVYLVIELNMGLFLYLYCVREMMSWDFVVDGVVTGYIRLIMMISVVVNEALDEVSGVFVGGLVLIRFCIVERAFLRLCDMEVLAVSRAISIEISSVASIVVTLFVETPCECLGITLGMLARSVVVVMVENVSVSMAVAAIVPPIVVLALVSLLSLIGLLGLIGFFGLVGLFDRVTIIVVVNSFGVTMGGTDRHTVAGHDRCGLMNGGHDRRTIGNDGIVNDCVMSCSQEIVRWDIILHLASEEDLGEGKTNRVTKLIEVLVLPLSLSIHDLVVHILAVNDQIVLNVEDEVPRVGESLGHLAELVKVSADGGLAFLELVGDVMDDVTHVLDGVED